MRFYDFEKKQPRKDELILIKTTNIGKPECYQIARYKCDNTNNEFQFVRILRGPNGSCFLVAKR